MLEEEVIRMAWCLSIAMPHVHAQAEAPIGLELDKQSVLAALRTAAIWKPAAALG